jgi:alanine racemase
MRPIKATIHINALKSNFALVKKIANKSKVMAVLKANAYGHGLLKIANALTEVDGISVLSIKEAIKLREANFNKVILLLEGPFEANEIVQASALSINLTIHNQVQLDLINQVKPSIPINIHLKINTGMNRLGFPLHEIDYLIESLNSNQYINEITLMTHFGNADDEVGIEKQMRLFNEISNNYNYSCSVANSAALIKFPESRVDWVRPGIMLYGASPFENKTAQSLELKPVMSFTSKIIAIQDINSGDFVGYGSVFKAEKPMRIGIVACGYGDGYPRHAKIGTPVYVGKTITELVGRVSMDMLYIDITNIDVEVGVSVELWGGNISVDEVARNSGTVGYELLCNISASNRVPLDYINA